MASKSIFVFFSFVFFCMTFHGFCNMPNIWRNSCNHTKSKWQNRNKCQKNQRQTLIVVYLFQKVSQKSNPVWLLHATFNSRVKARFLAETWNCVSFSLWWKLFISGSRSLKKWKRPLNIAGKEQQMNLVFTSFVWITKYSAFQLNVPNKIHYKNTNLLNTWLCFKW